VGFAITATVGHFSRHGMQLNTRTTVVGFVFLARADPNQAPINNPIDLNFKSCSRCRTKLPSTIPLIESFILISLNSSTFHEVQLLLLFITQNEETVAHDRQHAFSQRISYIIDGCRCVPSTVVYK
jgi:hypothetical protein